MEFFCKGDNHCHEQKNIQDVMDEIQGAIPHLVIEDLKPIQVKAGSKLPSLDEGIATEQALERIES